MPVAQSNLGGLVVGRDGKGEHSEKSGKNNITGYTWLHVTQASGRKKLGID